MSKVRAPSLQTKTVLSALLEAGAQGGHGYDLIQSTGIKSGTLYPILIRLTDQGFAESEWRKPSAPGRPPRQIYRLTASGLVLAKQNPPEAHVGANPSTGPATA